MRGGRGFAGTRRSSASGAGTASLTDICHHSIAVLDGRLAGSEIAPRMSDVALQQQQMLDEVGQRLRTATAHCRVHGTRKYVVGQLQTSNHILHVLPATHKHAAASHINAIQ